jgi:alkaline phosphatase D
MCSTPSAWPDNYPPNPLSAKIMLRHSATASVLIAAILAFFQFSNAKPPTRNDKETPLERQFGGYLLDVLAGSRGKGGRLGADAGVHDLVREERFRELVQKFDLRLMGGPMVGRLEGDGASFWVRTTQPARVQVVVPENPHNPAPRASEPVFATPETDLTAICQVNGLQPFTRYAYNVYVDGKPVYDDELPTFRTAPADGQPARFSVAFGGGAKYIPGKESIWGTVADRDPLAFLFLGDNVYIDNPKRRDVQRAYYYRRQVNPYYRKLTSTTGIYAIWDDHDFGKNDSAGGLEPFKPEWKLPVYNVFRQNWVNPYYGGGPRQPGCWHHFSLGDVDFIMTDGRYYRAFKQGTMLGPVQKEWLKQRIRKSTGKFVVLASGTLWTEHADKGGRDSWWGVPQERNEIFQTIVDAKVAGVILISADRHRTDVYKIDYEGCYPLYEFETSRLTNNHVHRTREAALWSYNKGNFFGMLTFDLTKDDPTVTFRCITAENEEPYSLTLKRSELDFE